MKTTFKHKSSIVARLSFQFNTIIFSILLACMINTDMKAQVPQFYNTDAASTLTNIPLNIMIGSTSKKAQWIYGPNLFSANGSGIGTPAYNGNITTIYFKMPNVDPAAVYTDFTIKLGQVAGSQNTFGAGPTGLQPFITNLTTCYYSPSRTLSGAVANAWYPITLQTPFTYNPAFSLVVEIQSTSGYGNSVAQIVTSGLMQRNYGSYNGITGTANTGLLKLGFDEVSIPSCSGAPNPGNTISSTGNLACNGVPFNLTLQNPTAGSGVTYQWFNNGGAIPGATSYSYNTSLSTANTFYCNVTCTSTGMSANSTPISLTMNAYMNCYCETNSSSGSNAGSYGTITKVVLDSINNTSSFPSVSPYFTNYPVGPNTTTTVTAGVTYPCSIHVIKSTQAAVWIDWNHNGVYENTEFTLMGNNTSTSSAVLTQNITVPFSALSGTTKMRVRSKEYFSSLFTGSEACLVTSYGETEEYTIQVFVQSPCSGAPMPGNTLSSSITPCSGTSIDLSVANTTNGTGISYQWYNSTGAISGATLKDYSTAITNPATYYCALTCANSGITTNSNPISINLNNFINCYCTPPIYLNAVLATIFNVHFDSINHASTHPGTAPFYTNYLPMAGTTTSVVTGNAYQCTVNVGIQTKAAVWIDWNHNSIFEASEYTSMGTNTSTSFLNLTQTILVPLNALAGPTKMRIRSNEWIASNFTSVDACTASNYGEVEDYTINVIVPIPCTGAPSPGSTVASSTNACPGIVINFSLSNTNLGSGLLFQWYNNAGAIAGATNKNYSTIISTANTIYCNVTCVSSGITTASNSISLTSNFMACYCLPNSMNGSQNTNYAVISNVIFESISQTSNEPIVSPFYTNYSPTPNTTATVLKGDVYPISVTTNRQAQVAVWFDWDHNGSFDASEYLFIGNNATLSPMTFTQNVSIPTTALTGVTKMRIRSREHISQGPAFTASDACLLTTYGESEDYEITIVSPMICAGSPSPGNTIASSTNVCAGSIVSFGMSNPYNGSGISYQWYHNSGAITGATNSTHSQAVSMFDDFWCEVTCVNSALSTSSNLVSITMKAALDCYCMPSSTFGCTGGDVIAKVILNTLNNNSGLTCVGAYSGYTDYTTTPALTTELATGTTYNCELFTGPTWGQSFAIWMDMNDDGVFDNPTERLGYTPTYVFGGSSEIIPITIPCNATVGTHRLRIRSTYGIAGGGGAITPCGFFSFGEVEDYNITIIQNPNTMACIATLNLTCVIQGYWNGINEMNSVLANQGQTSVSNSCDSIDVELHDTLNFLTTATCKAVLHKDGSATCIFPPLNGTYYIVVKHRNALETWSAYPVSINSGTSTNYNFTTAANQAYGNNMIEVVAGVWAFYSGDINQDENIDLLDQSLIANDINNYSFGYYSTDINGDGNVDLLDAPLVESNINQFIYSMHP